MREQSKEIATQIRDNVRKEEQRQLSVVNEIRQNEYLDWRQQQLDRIDNNYKHCMTQFGEAHIAAQRENEKQRVIDEQKEKNRRMALRRGKEALDKLREAKSGGKPCIRPICKKSVTIVERNVGSSQKTPATPEHDISSTSSSSSLSSSSDSSVCSVIETKKPKSARSTSSLNHLSVTPKKSALKSSRSTGSSPIGKKPTKYVSINGSAVIDLSLSDNSHLSDASPVPITKISDLIKGSDIPYKQSPKSPAKPLVSRTYKVSGGADVATKRNKVNATAQPITTTPTSSFSTKSTTKSAISKVATTKTGAKQYVPEFVKAKAGNSVNAKKVAPTSTLPQKVQFYDHANRFSKEYDTNLDLVDEVRDQTNAWDEAIKENRRIFSNRNGSRKLEEDRAKVALEKEKIRKDYDLMSSQLSSILKDEQLTKSFLDTNEMLSESRLRQIAEEKQLLMEKGFEGILKQSVPITCPKVSKKSTDRNRELNVAYPKANATSNGHDTSQSFLLDYVMARTNNICDDIERCRIENDQIPNQSKIKALHTLLNKVNALRRILCEEIKGNNDGIDASKVIDEVEAVAREQHKIMDDTLTPINTNREHKLAEREKLLKEKESCIDKKVYELYLREKKMKEQNKKDEQQVKRTKIVTENCTKTTVNDEIPVKIVINVNKKDEVMNGKCSKQDPIKWADRLTKSTQSKDDIEMARIDNVQPTTTKQPLKSKSIAFERRQFDDASQATSITAYMSPPTHMQTQLTKALHKNGVPINGPTHQRDQVDNELIQYIARLLGMSRTSIEQLNVSSVSTVRTPNSSVINITNNQQFISSTSSTPLSMSSLSFDQGHTIDKNKMQQLARFLAQHQSTPPSRENGDRDSSIENGTWNHILNRRSDQTKSKSNEQSDKLKTISGRANQMRQPNQNDLISKYDELTANCTKRIIDLDSMISKVREEKQKILENTLSSGGSLVTATRDNQTEYLDYGGGQQQQQQRLDTEDAATFPLSDSKSTNAASSEFDTSPSEHRVNLMATRWNACGGSKDSGVGVSRPVTSSDYRESPDLRVGHRGSDVDGKNKTLMTEALAECKQNTGFEPMLRDIPKSSYRIGSENGAQNGGAMIEVSSQSAMNGREKNGKHPPIALTR